MIKSSSNCIFVFVVFCVFFRLLNIYYTFYFLQIKVNLTMNFPCCKSTSSAPTANIDLQLKYYQAIIL